MTYAAAALRRRLHRHRDDVGLRGRRVGAAAPGPAYAGRAGPAAAVRPAPSIRFEDYPREVAKPTIGVSEAAARLAAAIHPYLD